MSAPCDFDNCKQLNIDTALVTKDSLGYRLFCDDHWKLINLLFSRGVTGCVREKASCFRNHSADLYESFREQNSIKFDGRWYNLCSHHLGIYENILSLWLGA
jgi:hypothetical protein